MIWWDKLAILGAFGGRLSADIREKVCNRLTAGRAFQKTWSVRLPGGGGLAVAFGGEKSPIGDSQYGSPPWRSFYSCKRNQNTLGAPPQDPCRWLCWIRIDLRREPKSIRTAHRIALKVACGSICPFPPPPFPRRERGPDGRAIRNQQQRSRGVRACRGGRVAGVGARDYDWPKDEPLTYGYG